MRKIAITFADEKYHLTLQRFQKQLIECGSFDEVIAYTPKDFDEEFLTKHQDFINKNSRGYGYWIWKPYIIYKTLIEKCKEGDILFYADAGCTLSKPVTNLIEFCKQSQFGVIAGPSCLVREFTKMDLFSAIGIPFEQMKDKWMVEAGRLVIQKRDHTMNFIKEWWDFSQQYHLIDDTPSIETNHPGFQDHRHDQSIFTLLAYKYGVHVIPYEGTVDATRLKF
jgi:hypothetical protein